jgi:TrfA protein
LIKLFGEDDWTGIEWQRRLQLRRKPLAQALHAYYSSHRSPFPVRLSTLQGITGSKNSQAASFKRQCRVALESLVEIGFLLSFSFDRDVVSVKRNLATHQSRNTPQHAQLSPTPA